MKNCRCNLAQGVDVMGAQEAAFDSIVRHMSWVRSERAPPRTGGLLRGRCQIPLVLKHGKDTLLNHIGDYNKKQISFRDPSGGGFEYTAL